MNKKTSNRIMPTGLLLTAFAFITSTLLGFGGFNMQAFGDYVITGYVSKLQMVFLILVGLGLILSGVAYFNQAKKQKLKKSSFILLLHVATSMVFFVTSFFGLASKLKPADFWIETTFEEVPSTLFFNNMTLTSFLVLGILQVALAIMFSKNKLLQQHRLSKVAKTMTLTSGLLLIIKTVIDYPFIKEIIFIMSYLLKIPFPNNIVSIIVPLIYLLSQIPVIIIMLHNKRPLAKQ